MVQTNDALSLLQEFSWRGTQYPIISEKSGFRNEMAEHKVSFGDLTVIQPLGARAWTFSYMIPLRNGVMRGPYSGLFEKAQSLASDCRNKTKGKLYSPMWGEFMAVATSFEGDLDAHRRDGIDIAVEFIHAPDEEEAQIFIGGAQNLQSLINNAGALDADVRKRFRDYEEEPPSPTVDPLQAVSGLLRQVERNGQKIAAALDNFAYRCEAVETATNELIRVTRDMSLCGITAAARRNRRNAYSAKAFIENSGKTVVDLTTASAMHVITLAASVGMSAKDFVVLNPGFASNPTIPAGSKVKTYARQ